jgi:hypothetical protein
MSIPMQIDTLTAKMMPIDPDLAADFSHAMYAANKLADRASALRSAAWRSYRQVMALPEPSPTKRKSKGGVR